jgi:two-component system chemotaxis response regulator CheY
MDTSIPVLVVDDSQTMSLIISKNLQELGFADVDMAEDGQSALDRLSQKHYGLILSDWEMQPMSGEQFLTEIGRRFRKIPVILISATAGRGTSCVAGAERFSRQAFQPWRL